MPACMLPQTGTADSFYAWLVGSLAVALAILCISPLFGHHFTALRQDEQLYSGLAKLMLPAISAMAVGLQLPPERRPPECAWRAAAQMSLFVSYTPVNAARQLVAAQPQAAQRLVAAAAQLLQHCPFPAPATADLDPYEALETTLFFIYLLHAACHWHACSCGKQDVPPGSAAAAAAEPAPPDRRLVQHLLALPPKLDEALAALARDPCTSFTIAMDAALQTARLLSVAAQPLSNTPGPAAALAGTADLPAWCRAAAAVLHWLPLVADMQARVEVQDSTAEQQGSQYHAAQAEHVARWPSALALALCADVSSHCVRCVQRAEAGWAAASPALQAECLQAFWELHTKACRLVHWLAAGRAPRMLPALSRPLVLSEVLTRLLEASVHLCQASTAAPSLPNAARCAGAGVGRCAASADWLACVVLQDYLRALQPSRLVRPLGSC